MRDMEQIRKWKKLWGYDDLQVRPGGKMAKNDAPFRLLENMALDLETKAKTDVENAESLREQEKKLRAKAKSLTGLEYDPMDGPLAKSIEARVVDRRTADTTAARDQIADDFYTEARGEELNTLVFSAKGKKKHYLAEGFGMRTIADRREKKEKDKISGIRMFNEYNAAYQRGDASKKYKSEMAGLYEKKRTSYLKIRKRAECIQSKLDTLETAKRKVEEREAAIKKGEYNPEIHGPKKGEEDAPDKLVENYEKEHKDLLDSLGELKTSEKEMPASDGVFFVNSPAVIKKLNTIYGPNWADPNPVKEGEPTKFKPTYFNEIGAPVPGLIDVGPGILALRMDKAKMDAEQRKVFQDRLLDGTGSTPSSYDLVRAVNDDTDILAKGAQDENLDNTGALKSMAEGRGCKALADIPASHPMAQPAQAAANMVDGLAKALAKTLPGFDKDNPLAALASGKAPLKTNKVLASCLAKIGKLTDLLASYVEDAPRFARFFDLLADEVNLVLSITKPYKAQDFDAATKKINEDRIPVTKELAKDGVKCQTFMASGGMAAMSTAIQIAYEQTGASQVFIVDGPSTHGATYFEVEGNIIGKDSKAKDDALESKDFKPPVILGTLNPSTPVTQKDHPKGWSVGQLIDNIKGKLEPCADKLTVEKPAFAIIDITVEKDEKGKDQEVDKLVSAFADDVKAGKLVFMLNKSYQKYPALGTGKTMAGGLTVIGKGGAAEESLKGAAETQKTEGQLEREENQLVMHFLTHEADIERKMLDRAGKNAKFLNGLMPEVKGQPATRMAYDEGLPFLVLDDTSVTFKGNNDPDDKKREKRMQWVFHGMGLENRMSFAFQNSACLGIDEGRFRIGVGVEPESEMVEKMYSTVRLASLDGDARSAPIEPGFLTATSDKAIGKASEALSGMLTEGLDNDQLSKEPNLTEVKELNEKSAAISAKEYLASRLDVAFTETKAENFPVPQEKPSDSEELANWQAESAQWRSNAVELLDQHQDCFDSMPFFRRYEDGGVEVDVSGYSRSTKTKIPDPMTDDFYTLAAAWTDKQIQHQLAELKKIKSAERTSAQEELKRQRGAIDDPLGEAVKLRKEASELRLELAKEVGAPKESVATLVIADDGRLVLNPTVLASLKEAARKAETDDEEKRAALLKKLVDKRMVTESRALTKATEDKDKELRDGAAPKVADKNAAWREKTVRRLLKAKMLEPSKIVRGGPENIIISPSDTALKDILGRAQDKPTDQMKLLAAMRTTTIDNPAHDLSTARRPEAAPPTVDIPDAKNDAWRNALARLLMKEGLLEKYDLKMPDAKRDGELRELKAKLETKKKDAWKETVLKSLPEVVRSKLLDPVEDNELVEAAARQRDEWTRQATETLKGGAVRTCICKSRGGDRAQDKTERAGRAQARVRHPRPERGRRCRCSER
ncbi:hypothetical protein [Sedimentitalea sp.]|uniref:hypothetical protein n=1 Tax=Sedimentitalea sp. TaxID=2048915 RepID=UPI0032973986